MNSRKKAPKEDGGEKAGIKNPAILAAIITALATIAAALIGIAVRQPEAGTPTLPGSPPNTNTVLPTGESSVLQWTKNPELPSIDYLPGIVLKIDSSSEPGQFDLAADQLALIFGKNVTLGEIGKVGDEQGCFIIAAKGPILLDILSLDGLLEVFTVTPEAANPVSWAAWRKYLTGLSDPACKPEILVNEIDNKGDLFWVSNPKLPTLNPYPGMGTQVSNIQILEDTTDMVITVNSDEILIINGSGGLFPNIGIAGGPKTCTLLVTKGPWKVEADIYKDTLIEVFKASKKADSAVWAAWKSLQMRNIGCNYIETWIGN